ncbi:uncharacterized protein G2W53_035022 [Senna tora]|uniref:F-box associated domain-containing protein n=1 Tax=Senna tora TaxID=362788 RepID=A0A834W8V3_9FABA|nr:uncharacterized protein G2W53_035022 [Senna tora]
MTLHIDRYLVWISKELQNNWLCPEALFVYDTHDDSFKHIPIPSPRSRNSGILVTYIGKAGLLFYDIGYVDNSQLWTFDDTLCDINSWELIHDPLAFALNIVPMLLLMDE